MKFLIATNHSYMLWQFRKELIQTLLQKGKVVLAMPFVGHEDDSLLEAHRKQMGICKRKKIQWKFEKYEVVKETMKYIVG